MFSTITNKDITFEVHSNGDIFSIPESIVVERIRNGQKQKYTHVLKRKKLSSSVNNNGYLDVSCKRNGKRPKISVHRLMALAFVPGYFEGATVNHINGIKTDNRIDNLEWVSLSKNSQLEWGTGLCNARADNHGNAKLSSRKVRIIRRALRFGLSSNEIATLCGVSASLILLIKQGVRWNSVV